MTADSLTPPPLERLLAALLELPPLLPLPGLASPQEAVGGAAQVMNRFFGTGAAANGQAVVAHVEGGHFVQRSEPGVALGIAEPVEVQGEGPRFAGGAGEAEVHLARCQCGAQ